MDTEQIWGMGRIFVGAATFQSASYIARYCTKSKRGDTHTEILDLETGELYYRTAEYGTQSTKPGLGATWVTKYANDIYQHDRVVINGRSSPLPRYYNKLLARTSPLYHENNRAKRLEKQKQRYAKIQSTFVENGGNIFDDPLRLEVEEQVKLAQITSLKRN